LIVGADDIPTVLSVTGDPQPIGQYVLYETEAIGARVTRETVARGVVEASRVQ